MSHLNRFLPCSFAASLSDEELRQLLALGHEGHYRKGCYVLQPAADDRSLYLLLAGRIKVSRVSEVGQEMIQWFCLPGDIFGISGIHGVVNNVLAKTLTDCVSLRITKADFDQLIFRNPHIGLLVIDRLSSRLNVLGEMVLGMANDDANTRLLRVLSHLAEHYGQHSGDGVYVDLPVTHQDLGDMIGACRQTVSQLVASLRRSGLVEMDRKGFHLHSRLYE